MCVSICLTAPLVLSLTLFPVAASTPSLGSFVALSQKVQQASLKDLDNHPQWHASDVREGLSLSQQKVASMISSMVDVEIRAMSSLTASSQTILIIILLCTPLVIVFSVALFYHNAQPEAGQNDVYMKEGEYNYSEERRGTPSSSPAISYIPSPQAGQLFAPGQRTRSDSQATSRSKGSAGSGPASSRGGHPRYPVSRSQSSKSGHSRRGAGYPASISNATASSRGVSPVMQDDEILYPQLVVHHPGGMKYRLNGTIEAKQQEELLEVCHLDNPGYVEVRIFISESPRDCSILLESGSRSPIAFMNTANAFRGGIGFGDQHVTIRRMGRGHGGKSAAPFAVACKDGSNVVMRRNLRNGGSAMVQTVVAVDASEITVLGEGGGIIAVADRRPGSMDIRVMPGTDAALVLCSLIAAFKLAL
mmetsp:Transcript_53981/g.94735  ORF Transcript_53981/g.94735 Transcript_53981/m.94735 type:complete len:419 (+) Transcript_53981:107-1363(+)